ncbi:hypothetical protein [Nonomuraea sp. GTA35]|uniref:hypothetical protein n=1 Tax=Nonomuraea sp. GTA35 TaxID=1676746 RepID=UPI0035C250A7
MARHARTGIGARATADRGRIHGTAGGLAAGSVAMARTVLDSVQEIQASPRAAAPDALERLLSDLEDVHRDYLVMFETIPDAFTK